MELPEEVVELKERLRKQARKQAYSLWKKTKSTKIQELQNQEERIYCQDCDLYGHERSVHVIRVSLYEIIGGRVGCFERVLVHQDPERVNSKFFVPRTKVKRFHKQNQRMSRW